MHKLIRRTLPLCALALLLLLLPACTSQRTFSSPDLAAGSLVDALRTGDQKQLKQILGDSESALISSGDPIADQYNREKFIAAYDVKHSLAPAEDGGMNIIVGEKDWPMPIPIVKVTEKDKDVWRFDTAAGQEEIINRRIGHNELDTIQTCLAIVDAQREYTLADPDHDGVPAYARKFLSDPDKKNGLYWPTAEGEPPSPLGDLVAAAAAEGYAYADSSKSKTGPHPYHGYIYRILTAQGPSTPGGAHDYMVGKELLSGFAVVACPVEYGSSGIMTFIVNQDGVVYQRDLGPNTLKIANQMKTFDPDSSWIKADATPPPAE